MVGSRPSSSRLLNGLTDDWPTGRLIKTGKFIGISNLLHTRKLIIKVGRAPPPLLLVMLLSDRVVLEWSERYELPCQALFYCTGILTRQANQIQSKIK